MLRHVLRIVAGSSLSVFILAADAAAQDPRHHSCYKKVVAFQAHEPWFNSGVVLTGGESIVLVTNGRFTLHPGAPRIDPRGFTTSCTAPDCPIAPNYGGSLARIGAQDPFAIQKWYMFLNFSPYPVQTGALEFMLNDSLSALSDNKGKAKIGVTVCTGVTLHADAKYTGEGIRFTSDVADLSSVSGPCSGSLNECISSLQVSQSWTMTAYENPGYTGAFAIFTEDTPNLASVSGPCGGTWNDCISSFRLTHK